MFRRTSIKGRGEFFCQNFSAGQNESFRVGKMRVRFVPDRRGATHFAPDLSLTFCFQLFLCNVR
jgi:hypothetical protein